MYTIPMHLSYSFKHLSIFLVIHVLIYASKQLRYVDRLISRLISDLRHSDYYAPSKLLLKILKSI